MKHGFSTAISMVACAVSACSPTSNATSMGSAGAGGTRSYEMPSGGTTPSAQAGDGGEATGNAGSVGSAGASGADGDEPKGGAMTTAGGESGAGTPSSAGSRALAGAGSGGASGSGSSQGGAGGGLSMSTKVLAIAGGNSHLCAILDGGSVRCWGANGSGQLGNSAPNGDQCQVNPCSTRPVNVAGLSSVTAIAAGQAHTCGLLADGTVACWGDNSSGQLGSMPEKKSSSVPLPVPGLSGVTGLAAGATHTCALLSGGKVMCWGGNTYGELGSGTKMSSPSPAPVIASGNTELSGVTKITAGTEFSCALLTSGSVECWGGYPNYGELGGSSPSAGAANPVLVPDVGGALDLVSSSTYDTWSIFADGTTKCWGFTQYAGCGASPKAYPGLSMVKAIAPSYESGCALQTGGAVQCWGADPAKPSATPTTVTGLSDVTAIAASASVNCALSASGTVKCWGFGLYGDIGNGSTKNSATPVAALF